MDIEEIEVKQDSPEKLEAIVGKPSNTIIFAEEFNAIVDKLKNLFTLTAAANYLLKANAEGDAVASTIVDTGASVGIGTATPTSTNNVKMEVAGKVKVTDAVLLDTANSYVGQAKTNGITFWGDTETSYSTFFRSLGQLIIDLNKGNYGGREFKLRNNGVDVFKISLPAGTSVGATPVFPFIANANQDTSYTKRVVAKADGTFGCEDKTVEKITPISSFPLVATAGDMVFKTPENKHYGYDGVNWNALY